MSTSLQSTDFRPDLPSVREREVIDLAIEGQTDDQIAQAMAITVSTVNSYWVRIRGKVGQISRTEIVSRMLRDGSRDAQTEFRLEVERLSSLLAESKASQARAESDLTAEQGVAWHLLALRFLPESVLVVKSPGEVVYANLHAERLFDVGPGALLGCDMGVLTVAQGREDRQALIWTFMEGGKIRRMVMGIEEPVYALSRSDRNFRATITMEGFDAQEGYMAVLTVREFLGDVDAVLRSLRKPLVMA